MPQPVTSVLWNPDILVNSVDLSAKARKVNFKTSQEKKEVTAFGNTTRNYIPGMLTPSCDVEFYVDRATGGVVQTLRALVVGPGSTAGTVTLSVRALNSAATTSNEVYTMTVIIDGSVDLLNGTIGDVETTTVKFVPAAGSGFTTATTS